MDPGPSAKAITVSSESQAARKAKRKHYDDASLYAFQVQAFLDAAEDVGIDAETVEDILDGFPGNEMKEESAGGVIENLGGHGTSVSELSTSIQDGKALSQHDINQMKWYLKERGMTAFLKEYVLERGLPILQLLCAFGISLCKELREKRPSTLAYFLKVALSIELRQREKLSCYNTVADAVGLILRSQRIMIITGAGISVSCGIPDFRSRDGLYASLKDKGQYDLDDPQQMFDMQYFRENPSVFYSFASQIYPSNFTPSPCHRFIKLIEDKGKLLRNYTQNIDTLETLAGVQKVLQCHGSFATATCLQCRLRVPGADIEQDILQQRVSLCKICNSATPAPTKPPEKNKKGKKSGSEWKSDESDEPDEPEFPPGIMKPDITFFGEKLTDEFDHALMEDRDKVDLLLIMGTSLQVSPVSEAIAYLPHLVPQILINKTPIKHINPDIVLLGNADDIVHHLCSKLRWELPKISPPEPLRANLRKRPSVDLRGPEPRRVANSHVWLFEGAEGGRYVKELEGDLQEPLSDDTSSVLSEESSDGSDEFRAPKKPRRS